MPKANNNKSASHKTSSNRQSSNSKAPVRKSANPPANKKALPKNTGKFSANADSHKDRGADRSLIRHQLMPYILGLIAVFLVICYVFTDSTGAVGKALKQLFFGLFSGAAWAIPFLLVNLGIFWKRDVVTGAIRYKFLFTLAVLIFISVLINAFNGTAETFNPKMLWADGVESIGGGVIGGLVGNLLLRGFGFAGTLIFSIALILLFGIFLFGMTPQMFAMYIFDGIRELRSGFRQQIETENILREQVKIEMDQRRIAERQAALRLREQQLRNRMNENGTSRRQRVNDALDEYSDDENSPYDYEKDLEGGVKSESEALVVSKKSKTKIISDKLVSDEDENPIDVSVFDGLAYSEQENDNSDVDDNSEFTDENVVESDAPPFNESETSEKEEAKHRHSFFNKDKNNSIDEVSDDEELDLAKIFVEPDGINGTDEINDTDEYGDDSGDINDYDIQTSAEIDFVIEKSRLDPPPMPEPILDEDEEDDDTPPFEVDNKTIEKIRPMATEEYRFPPVTLLTRDNSGISKDMSAEIQQTAVKLVETLRSFNVKTKIINVSRGPTVTRYELQPEVGTKVRSIVNLVDDIALHLATSGVRIEAPIPGKEAVGIEVPNKNSSTVFIRELIEDDSFKASASKVTTTLGADVGGNSVFLDVAKMPHLLIAGTTGSGKSVCINSLIISMLYKARPDEVKFILIDPKKVELNPYNGIPHLLVPVVSDPKKAAGSLHWAVTEMERRYELIEGAGVRNLKGYNNSIANDPDAEKLPLIVIVIDELADLMMTAKDDVEDSIIRIAQKARAAGIHLIIGTQRPSVDVITGLIKANVPSRIAFTTMSQVDSRTIIDTAGAEKLIGRGDMLYAPIGSMKPTRVQGCFVSDEEVELVTTFIKQNYGVRDYDQSVIDTIEREAQLCGNKKATILGDGDEEGNDGDPMLKPAIQLAVESGKISTSLIQRRLQLGYGRAAKLIDEMEERGIVGPPQGQKPREVLISKQEYLEMELRSK